MRYRIALALLALVLMKPVLAQTCPAGNPRVAPDSRYQVSEPVTGQFVVEDLRTGLMWKQCVQGRSGAGCATGADSLLTWSQALLAASSETHAGHSDWRLPSANELNSLVEIGCYSPAINTTIFPNTASVSVRSSTTFANAGAESFAWVASFSVGGLSVAGKSASIRVRLVRDGQGFDPFNAAGDFSPDEFSFAAQTGVPISELRTSASITVSGIDTVVGIGVSGAADSAYSINGGPFVSAPGAVANGDAVIVRHTSAPTELTSVTTTLQIGALTADFVSTTLATSFTIGGTVTGLADGNSVVLRNNGADDLTVSVNDAFTFATPLPDSSGYNVTVFSQPTDPNQTCDVVGGEGVLEGANITDIEVVCSTDTYLVTPQAGVGGSLNPDTPQTVAHGETASFEVEADPGYSVGTVEGCGGTLVESTFTTGPVTTDCTVSASFMHDGFTITIDITPSGAGSASCMPNPVPPGGSAICTASPTPSHAFIGWAGACDGMSCELTNVNEPLSIIALFEIIDELFDDRFESAP